MNDYNIAGQRSLQPQQIRDCFSVRVLGRAQRSQVAAQLPNDRGIRNRADLAHLVGGQNA